MERTDFGAYAAFVAGSEKFARFTELLLFCNARFNLTAITDPREIFYKHYLDSLAGERFLPRGARVTEVGSGAGFPSVPLMLYRPDLSFTLVESTGKKCEFLKSAVSELNLHAEVVNARAEVAARGSLRESADGVVARAVAPLETLAEYCLPLVKRGGIFVAYKGEKEELPAAEKAIETLGGRAERTVVYELPEGYGSRSLVLVRKKGKTPEKYPRGNGRERKDPIR